MPSAKGVWVFSEHHDGKLRDGSLELVSEGRKIADKMAEELTAVLMGKIPDEQIELLARFGADCVLLIEHPALNQHSIEIDTQVLADVIAEHSPNVFLLVDSIRGADLAGRLAAQLETGLVTGCDRLDVNPDRLLTQTKPVYGSQAVATFVCPTAKPQMATVNLDALELKTLGHRDSAEVITLNVSLEPEKPNTQVVGFIEGDPRAIDLTEAEIVVAGGKGLGSQSNFKLIEELAELIGGSVGATRMAVDQAWITADRQIGLTGKTVKPRLYIACGISGAIQHTMGMKDSKIIIAINWDRNAPIFKIADVGIIGDVLEIVPLFTAELRQTLAQHAESSVDEVPGAADDT